jgi:hypothetical protein
MTTNTSLEIKVGSQASTWTERTTLLSAQVRYLMSVEAKVAPENQNIVEGRLENIEGSASVEVDRTRRIPPSGALEPNTTFRLTQTFNGLKLEGELLVELDGPKSLLRFICSGLFVPDRRGPPVFGANAGLIRLSSSQECDVAALRWITRTRLFGVGRIDEPNAKNQDAWARLSLDFYAPISFP